MTEYVVRINRKDGSLEVSADDKNWVDQKLNQLDYVYKDVPTPDEIASIVHATPIHVAPTRTASKSKPAKKSSSAKRPEMNTELNKLLSRDVTQQLNKYIDERKKAFGAKTSQTIIIAIFLEDQLSWKGVDKHDLYTVYRQLGIPAGNLDATLRNATARNGYFSHVEEGKYIPSAAGETFARFDSRDVEA